MFTWYGYEKLVMLSWPVRRQLNVYITKHSPTGKLKADDAGMPKTSKAKSQLLKNLKWKQSDNKRHQWLHGPNESMGLMQQPFVLGPFHSACIRWCLLSDHIKYDKVTEKVWEHGSLFPVGRV